MTLNARDCAIGRSAVVMVWQPYRFKNTQNCLEKVIMLTMGVKNWHFKILITAFESYILAIIGTFLVGSFLIGKQCYLRELQEFFLLILACRCTLIDASEVRNREFFIIFTDNLYSEYSFYCIFTRS